MKYQFMQAERKAFPIEKMAKVFNVSVSGYYAHVKRKPSLREEYRIGESDQNNSTKGKSPVWES